MSEFDQYDRSYAAAMSEAMKGSRVSLDFATRTKSDLLLDLIASHWGDPGEAEVLDFGCGIGLYESLLDSRVKRMTGIDVSSACVEVARNRNPGAHYVSYEGEVLPFAASNFDVVFAITVLHHVPPAKWNRAVAECRRVLRPGGLMFIFEHNPFNPGTRWIVSRCEFDADAVLLSASRASSLLRDARFNDVHARFILTVPVQGAWARRVDTLLQRLPLGAQYYAMGQVARS